MDDQKLRGLGLELDFLRGRVTALEKALDAAGIAIPPTRQELGNEAAAEHRRAVDGPQWSKE